VSPKAVNINAADADELQNIPGIGPVLAKKIIGHRDRYGPFRRPEEILIIDGISEKRFREFRSFILINVNFSKSKCQKNLSHKDSAVIHWHGLPRTSHSASSSGTFLKRVSSLHS
jgi:competence ComEA-like helix-hairpin-helix protein